MKANRPEDFARQVEMIPGVDCWIWVGPLTIKGYGVFAFRGKRGAHCASFTLHQGEIPNGMHVLHRCDIPCCVRPDHLFLGTHAENMRDMGRKGRAKPASMPGSKHPSSKLNESDVIEIRRQSEVGNIKRADLASKYGVTPELIGLIVRRDAWKHI